MNRLEWAGESHFGDVSCNMAEDDAFKRGVPLDGNYPNRNIWATEINLHITKHSISI